MERKISSLKEDGPKAWPLLRREVDGQVEWPPRTGEFLPYAVQPLETSLASNPRIIVIRFSEMPIQERETLLKLIRALKRNRIDRQCVILALLHSKHRKLIEDLVRAKVDYVRYIIDEELDSTQLENVIDDLGPNDRPELLLASLCPFLHYSRIDDRHEMTVCGAYRDRMVLGGSRLNAVCETEHHLNCEYYLKPRRKK